MSVRQIIDETLRKSAWGGVSELERNRWFDCRQPSFETAHYINGFGYRDGKFRFKPDWEKVPYPRTA